MMEINKKELKKISYDFRCVANRLISCNYNNGMSILKMFLDYIEGTPIIYDFISCKLTDEQEVDYKEYSGAVFRSLGDTPDEEIAFIYNYLKYGNANFHDYYRGFAFRYGGQGNESVKNFNNTVVLPLINYIEGYLTRIGIEMGYDEDVQYMITINGGNPQVNIANDNSNIMATQNNGVDTEELDKLVMNIKFLLTESILGEAKEIINDNIEVLQEELKKETPRKGFIKTAITGLQSVFPKIGGSIKLMAAITSIIQFAMAVL